MAVRHTGETVLPEAILALLLTEGTVNGLHCLLPFAVEYGGIANLFPIMIRQADRVAKRVDLPFTLVKLFLHLRAVALPLAPGRAFVEAVSVGIDQDAGGLAIDSSDQHLPQVLILLRQGDEGVNLRRGVTQPHGVNISGDHERIRLAVYHLELTGRVQGIRVAVLEHPSQLRVLDTGLGSLQLLLYRLGGKLTGLGSRALAGVIASHLRGDRAKTLFIVGGTHGGVYLLANQQAGQGNRSCFQEITSCSHLYSFYGIIFQWQS